MAITNYTNLSELINRMLQAGGVSISDLVREAQRAGSVLAYDREGEPADASDLENGFIALMVELHRRGVVSPGAANESETQLIRLYESGKLAENGYGGPEGDQFLRIKWTARTSTLPVISNINL